jgi:hypothetical protein
MSSGNPSEILRFLKAPQGLTQRVHFVIDVVGHRDASASGSGVLHSLDETAGPFHAVPAKWGGLVALIGGPEIRDALPRPYGLGRRPGGIPEV